MDLQKESIRGEQSKRLLADPLLNEAFDTVAASLRAAWEATGEAQERERERLWLMAKLLGRVRGHLVEALETGRLADRQLAALDARHGAADGD